MRLLCLLLYPICLLLSPTFGQQTAVTSSGCPVADLQKCAEPLKARGVPLSKNLVLLLLQIPSPSQLRKSCQAYASVLPCFQARVADCGSAAQREILRQLANALRFLCSPFSALQQSQLMAHRLCIGRVLGAAQQGQCETDARQSMPASSPPVLHRCRTKCLEAKRSSVKMTCLIRTWLSEQNLCLLANMREECGRDAAAFYTQMQRQVFHTKFPLICDADVIDSEQTAKPMTGNFSSTPSPSIFVTAKKRGVKAMATRLSHVRFKLATGGSRATTTMALTTMAVPKAATSQQGQSMTATSSRAMTMTSPAPRKATSRRGKVITPGPATSLPNSAGNRTSSAAQHQKQQQTRVTAPASMAATISPAAVRKPKAANRATATLLVHSVPFVLFPPPTTLAQRKGTQQPKNQGPPRQRMFLPSRDGLMSNFWPRNSASPFGAARLFFFEVAPIEEITAQQFQLDLEGHGKSKN